MSKQSKSNLKVKTKTYIAEQKRNGKCRTKKKLGDNEIDKQSLKSMTTPA